MQKCLDVTIINLEVKALTFDKTKIVEVNIGHGNFQVTSIHDNDDTNACTFLSFGIIHQEIWRS